MTDAQIRKNIAAVLQIIKDCDDSKHEERVRHTWATCAARACQEIADEMERRIGKDVKK